MRSVSSTGDACRDVSTPPEEKTIESHSACSLSRCDEIVATSVPIRAFIFCLTVHFCGEGSP